MNKNLREVEALVELVNEYVSIEKAIEALPCGYISVKHIAGHTYNYRQWREGNKIVSSYVPEALLNGVKRKIAVRKENEALLKVVKKDLKKATRKVVKAELLSEADANGLLDAARNGEDISNKVKELVK
ncbi:MAG: hypothetical protein MJ217_02285 [Bacilli bacterium]|nr:hypothetical protein [Bacilli bacterium]